MTKDPPLNRGKGGNLRSKGKPIPINGIEREKESASGSWEKPQPRLCKEKEGAAKKKKKKQTDEGREEDPLGKKAELASRIKGDKRMAPVRRDSLFGGVARKKKSGRAGWIFKVAGKRFPGVPWKKGSTLSFPTHTRKSPCPKGGILFTALKPVVRGEHLKKGKLLAKKEVGQFP